jgi:WD40 repeat protein
MRILKGHGYRKAVRDLAFSSDGTKLASLGNDCTIRLWDLDAGTSTSAPGARDWAYGLSFAPRRGELAWGDGWGVQVWDFARGTVQRLPPDPAAVTFPPYAGRVDYSPDGRLLAAVGATVRLWHVQDWTWLPVIGYDSASTSLAFSPDGKTLVTSHSVKTPGRAYEHFLRFWDSRTRQLRKTLRGHTAQATSLSFAPNSQTLAAACEQSLLVWEVTTGAKLVHHKIDKQHFKDVAFTPDGRFLLLARNDKTVRVWDTQTWSEQAAFDWDIGAIVSVAVAPDGMRAAAGGDKGKIVVWDLDL